MHLFRFPHGYKLGIIIDDIHIFNIVNKEWIDYIRTIHWL